MKLELLLNRENDTWIYDCFVRKQKRLYQNKREKLLDV